MITPARQGRGRRERGALCDPASPVLTPERISEFHKRVLAHWSEHGRHELPWRRTRDPYAILVSEVMLQQTQVKRVVAFYACWLDAFPSPVALAAAPLEAVLERWQGLGYNRRALALKRAVGVIAEEHGGEVPQEYAALLALPGVGPATAAAVLAFSWGIAMPYIETNIRTVYLHEFFSDEIDVGDSALLPVVDATLFRDDPRTWYYALMDYGAHLKRVLPNPSRRSKHYTRQQVFEGSHRQLRASLLRAVLRSPESDAASLADEVGREPDEVERALTRLVAEGFLAEEGERFRIA